MKEKNLTNEKAYKEILKEHIKSKDRITHSISTANFMKKYARIFNIDIKKAYISGLLHDIAKEFSHDKIIKLADSFKKRKLLLIKDFNFKKKHAFLLHGVASAEVLIRDLDINDIEILEAACYHTLGGVNISNLSKFTFISDYCEPLRKSTLSNEIHKILTKENNFEKAYYYTYVHLVKVLLKKEKIICHESLEGYNEALRLWKEKE